MTSLVAWAGVDSHGVASMYIATDSRISWGAQAKWDSGRKVFGSRSRPEIFGYVGDVLFPSLILGQLADAPCRALTVGAPPSNARFEQVVELVKRTFESLPDSQKAAFRLAHAQRIGDGMGAIFEFSSLSWDRATGWRLQKEKVPSVSDSIVIWGSGSETVKQWKARWNKSSQGGTSRAIFSALCDAIGSGRDDLSGGAPQLIGLYRIGPARTIGVVHDGQPHLFGLRLDPEDPGLHDLEWRNHLFERCGLDGVRLESAQRHHAPKGLGLRASARDPAQQGVAADGAARGSCPPLRWTNSHMDSAREHNLVRVIWVEGVRPFSVSAALLGARVRRELPTSVPGRRR